MIHLRIFYTTSSFFLRAFVIHHAHSFVSLSIQVGVNEQEEE